MAEHLVPLLPDAPGVGVLQAAAPTALDVVPGSNMDLDVLPDEPDWGELPGDQPPEAAGEGLPEAQPGYESDSSASSSTSASSSSLSSSTSSASSMSSLSTVKE
eukprot:EG_transcript_43501